jgi:hypothetical protein
VKTRELAMRCLKARIVSWLNTSRVGAVITTNEGMPVVLAIYDNGRYWEPEPIQIPNTLGEFWGPDGPVNLGPMPPHPGEPDNEGDKPDGPDQ